MITSLDFVAVPSTDPDRTMTFYTETLGLRKDSSADYEFWVGDTCFAVWEPAKMMGSFTPQSNAHIALHVDDVEAARDELAAKGIEFLGDVLDTGVCHMALFKDPDGNDVMLHNRHTPR
jgi:predicted enzyme related to lactoylglutathione lyase